MSISYLKNNIFRNILPITLISVAALGLTACDNSPDDQAVQSSVTVALYEPVSASAIVPFPNDAFFADSDPAMRAVPGFTKDTSLNIPNASNAPFVTAANLQDGFSTVESAFFDMGGDVNLETAGGAIAPNLRGIVISDGTGVLTRGVDYELTLSPVVPRTRVLIKPLKPLKESTQYFVFVTKNLKNSAGADVQPSPLFEVVRGATKVTCLPSDGCTAADQAATLAGQNDGRLAGLNATQIGTLETLRRNLIHPMIANVAPRLGLMDETQISLAWSFITQSIKPTLTYLNTLPATADNRVAVGNSGLSTGDLGLGLTDTADIFAGKITVPYYLKDTSTAPSDILTTFFQSNGTNAGGGSALPDGRGGKVPCAAFTASVSTTKCFPQPAKQTDQNIPVLITVPNSNSGKTMPASGWPVVIFQHGITRNRTDMFAIAPTLASAGFVTIAIDLPLHGILANEPTAGFRNSARSQERTFDVDLDGTAGVDSSGTHFINLGSLATSRDNLRQGASDLMTLTKSLGLAGNAPVTLAADGSPNGTINVDPAKIYFVGHSLGGIVGTTFLGVNTEVKSSVIAMSGGGIGKLLDGSVSFGPRIAAGLAAGGVIEGTDTYETFLRFAQTLVDSGDPINYANTVNNGGARHILLYEVIGGSTPTMLPDQVVPNNVPRNAPSVVIGGKLSGTDPLAVALGLTAQTVTPCMDATMVGANTVLKFTSGDHGSILNPSADSETTVNMQRATAVFFARDVAGAPAGSTVGGNCGGGM